MSGLIVGWIVFGMLGGNQNAPNAPVNAPSSGGGGGGGGFGGGGGGVMFGPSTPVPQNYAPQTITSYASTSPGAPPTQNVFTLRKGANTPTYIAPPAVQNMISPGSALPAPAVGTGAGPRIIQM